MKKTLGLMLLLLNGPVLFANSDEIVIRGSKKISFREAPRQVIDSFKRMFPKASAAQYFRTPIGAAKDGWVLISSLSKNWPSEQVDYYTLAFNIKNSQYYVLFDKFGHLVKYKTEQKKSSLPLVVKQAADRLQDTFPGYEISGKNCFRIFNSDTRNEYYELIATRGNDKKHLYYSALGHLVRVKE